MLQGYVGKFLEFIFVTFREGIWKPLKKNLPGHSHVESFGSRDESTL